MGQVDPADDTVRRYVVHHFRFDDARHERRNVVVAAYDSEREWKAALDRHQRDLARRRDAGEPMDSREHLSGTVWEPGNRARAAYGHLVRRAMEHGVVPPDLDESRLPPNMGIFGPGLSSSTRRSLLGRLLSRLRSVLR